MNTILEQNVTVIDLLLVILALGLMRLLVLHLPELRKLSQLHWLTGEYKRIEDLAEKTVVWRKNGRVGTVLPLRLPLEYYGFWKGWRALMVVRFDDIDGDFPFCKELTPGDVRIAMESERRVVEEL